MLHLVRSGWAHQEGVMVAPGSTHVGCKDAHRWTLDLRAVASRVPATYCTCFAKFEIEIAWHFSLCLARGLFMVAVLIHFALHLATGIQTDL